MGGGRKAPERLADGKPLGENICNGTTYKPRTWQLIDLIGLGDKKMLKEKYCIVQYNIAITVQHRNVWVQSTPTV